METPGCGYQNEERLSETLPSTASRGDLAANGPGADSRKMEKKRGEDSAVLVRDVHSGLLHTDKGQWRASGKTNKGKGEGGEK